MPTPTSLDGLIEKSALYLIPEQVEQVKAAFEFGALAHKGQTRKAGGDYIWHPVAVAEILAEIQLDHESLIAAILHDVVEDTEYTKQDIIERFGDRVADIVDGVTKLGKVQFDTPQEAQAESFRKMILAMSRDIRVILIKLADRLHNMRTLGVMRPEKQRRIARETLEIYAPIAGRLGINSFRLELEDLGFKAMYPTRYAVLENQVKKAKGNRKEIVDHISDALMQRLAQDKITAEVIGREKHLYSLYKKMKFKKLNFDEILDIFAFRILVNTADDSYRALGTTHGIYKPFPGRFKDYIAIPKANGYQSLHTVVFGPFRAYIEVQIRTHVMHEVSEHGIAAHWLYKEKNTGSDKKTSRDKVLSAVEVRAQEWVKNLLEIQQSAGNSLDFLENVKIDLFPSVIYVFTPKGDIITLPSGATAVDFAYAVHSNVGHGAVGCRIDKKLMPLRTKLDSGQTIEIIKNREAEPNPAWLNFVSTAKARSQIRAYLKTQQNESASKLGEKLLTKALRVYNMSYQGLTEELRLQIAFDLKLENWTQLEEELGLGKRFANLVAKQIHDLVLGSEDQIFTPNHDDDTPLAITGTEGMVLNYANCCHPIPGDDIMGFISAEKGLVIHRQECRNVKSFKNDPEKWLDVHWCDSTDQAFDVELVIEARNERGTLATIASKIAENKTDIDRVRSEDKDETYSLMYITIKVKNRIHLADILRQLKRLPIIEKLHRT